MNYRNTLFLTGLLLTIISCYRAANNATTDQSYIALEYPVIIPADTLHHFYHGLRHESAVKQFYFSRGLKPAWLMGNGFSPLADSVISFIRSIRLYGLLPQDYHWQEIQGLSDTLKDKTAKLARTDILLTDAFFSMATHLRNGRLYKQDHKYDSSLVILLNEAIKENCPTIKLRLQEPQHFMYRQLREGLKELILRAEPLEQILLLSGTTVDSSEVSRQVIITELNMERWRRESPFPERYILVNIPSYILQVIEGEQVVLESKVIVGIPEKPTPVLTSVVRCFTIYPYWHVPRSIATEELLPAIQRDSTYVERHHFDVLDTKGKLLDPSQINWKAYNKNNFPYILRQREGADNSLGILKFTFSNRYAVYLHDTNAPRLFHREMRALSHGCIRMEKATDLAYYLVREDSIYCSPDDLEQYLGFNRRHEIDLVAPIPIYTRYFTAVYQNGSIHTFNDIYGKDVVLKKMLYTEEFLLFSDF